MAKSKKQQPEQPKKGGGIKLFGLLLILYAAACFLVNFRIIHLGVLAYAWLWNPLSLLTPKLVGNVWLISGALAWLVNGLFAIIWSIAIFLLGIIIIK